MHNAPSTRKIFLYQLLTLGIYFLVWCYRLGKDLSTALKQKAVPSMWWFLLPGGAYYWMWRMTGSLEAATGKRIKHVDTFLLYLVLSGLWIGGSVYFPDLSFHSNSTDKLPTDIDWGLVIAVAAIIIAVVAIINIILHAVFIANVQGKLNKIRDTK